MQVLGKATGAALGEYYSVCVAAAKVEPEWLASGDIPYGRIRWHRAEGQEVPLIMLNPQHGQPVFEHSAAHELGHMMQLAEGYPQTESAEIAGNTVLSKEIDAIGMLVGDLVLDPDTERRLSGYGLWVSDRFDDGFKAMATSIPKAPPGVDRAGTPLYYRNALNYAYSKAVHTQGQCEVIETLYRKLLPQTWALGETVFSCLPERPCDDAGTASDACSKVLEVLELGEMRQYLRVWHP